MNLRDHDQECEHGNKLAHADSDRIGSNPYWCYGGAEVKGPQFTAGRSAALVVQDEFGGYTSTGIAVARDQRYQILTLDPVEDTNPMAGVNPFRTLADLQLAKVIDDAVKDEVKRQLGPAIVTAFHRIRLQLNAGDPL